MKRRFSTCAAMALLVLVGCGGSETSEAPEADVSAPASMDKLSVYAVNYPLAYFAERIGGDYVEVGFPAPADVDPSEWTPDAETVAAYQNADLILLNGADYAKWVAKVSLPAARLVDTSAAFADRLLPLEETVTHTHGPEGEHSHAGWASVTWLDPGRAIEQATAIRDALVAAMPDREAVLSAGFESLRTDIESLEGDLGGSLAEGRRVLFSPPVYQYLADSLGLEARSVHWEPDEMPTEEQWSDLATLLAHHPAGLMIWEAEPLPESRRRLEEMGLEIVTFGISANRPAQGDWLSVMRGNAERLTTAGYR